MQMRYSPAFGGFFSEAVHGSDIPSDAISITDDLYRGLLAGQTGGASIVIVDGLPALRSRALSVGDLVSYAEGKQLSILSNIIVTHHVSADIVLDSRLDTTSITFLNTLGLWAVMNGAAAPPPTRSYENLDGSHHDVSPSQMTEFLAVVDAKTQATFSALKIVRNAIVEDPPTITTFAEIDAFAWPA